MDLLKINVLSKADSVPAQGVGSAFIEQVRLIKESKLLEVEVNSKRKDFDLIHIHSVNLGYYFKLNKYKDRNIVYVHFVPSRNDGSIKLPRFFSYIFNKYVNSFYKKASNLVVVNPAFKEPLMDLGIAEDKITYIPNFVDNKEFYKKNNDEISILKQKYNIPQGKFVVLGVGQIQTRKGIDDFIKVANENKEMLFLWAGGFSFGRITHGYRKYKKIMKNPPSNVRFLGILNRKEMNDVYNISSCLFMPSYIELFPMSILEASKIGLPILLRDVNLYEPILFDYYLKGNDVDSFSKKLQELIQNQDIYDEFAQNSLKINDYYNKNKILKMWEEFYFSKIK